MEQITSKALADKIVKLLEDRKAKDIEVINTQNVTIITDYFIICSGTSSVHLRGIAGEVIEKLKAEGRPCSHIEGYDSAKWILLDYLDVVVHIFLEEERAYYHIERLWRDGVKIGPDSMSE